MSEAVEPTTMELRLRLRQQELVAGFGRFSLRHDDLQMNLDEACSIAADGLSTRYAKVLRYLPQSGDFVVCAGIGWHDGVVGQVHLGSDLASPAGYAFRTGEAVLSNYLGAESRFRTPGLLLDHGIHSAINVLIGDSQGAHYGVLEVDSSRRDEFSRHDIFFLQSLANTIAEAVGRQSRMEAMQRSQELGRSLLEVSPDCVKIMSADGIVQVMNEQGACLLELDNADMLVGMPWESVWPEDSVAQVRAALAEARGGARVRLQAFCPTAKGTPKWWDIVVAAVPGPPMDEQRLVAISRDITDTVDAAASKDRLLREKDLLMLEVHHRVKNSLQMVQNLLSLQARAADDATTAEVLRESAARVHTIGAIHDRLYRDGSSLEISVGPYLQGLIDDLRDGMASTQVGRVVVLDADDATWPAAAVPALGLVTTELVTNALKYGLGVIRVTFRQAPGEQGTLTIEDEGDELPADFDPSISRGLGMRIVTGLLRPRGGGLAVLRDRSHTCLHATFPRDA